MRQPLKQIQPILLQLEEEEVEVEEEGDREGVPKGIGTQCLRWWMRMKNDQRQSLNRSLILSFNEQKNYKLHD